MRYFNDHYKRIHDAARRAVNPKGFSVLFVALHHELFAAEDFQGFSEPPIASLAYVSDVGQLETLKDKFNVAIVVNAATEENAALFHIRRRDLADFVFTWTWDNHHSFDKTLRMNALADVVVPGHKFCSAYMKAPGSVLGRHVPLGTNQWSRAAAAKFFQAGADAPRIDGLHGGFVLWTMGRGQERADLVKALSERLPQHALSLIGVAERARYHLAPAEERWNDWARCKVGLILPLARDLSTRFFDSLLTGQIPIVPESCADLDSVIPPALQRQLPVIRFAEETPAAIEAAWHEAIARYDAEGPSGALRRHRYALANHHVTQRLKAICDQLNLILDGRDVRIEADNGAVGFRIADP